MLIHWLGKGSDGHAVVALHAAIPHVPLIQKGFIPPHIELFMTHDTPVGAPVGAGETHIEVPLIR